MKLSNLIAARNAAGLSQTQAGLLIGKTQSHYCKIESGAVTLSARDALTLCRAFKLTLEKIIS